MQPMAPLGLTLTRIGSIIGGHSNALLWCAAFALDELGAVINGISAGRDHPSRPVFLLPVHRYATTTYPIYQPVRIAATFFRFSTPSRQKNPSTRVFHPCGRVCRKGSVPPRLPAFLRPIGGQFVQSGPYQKRQNLSRLLTVKRWRSLLHSWWCVFSQPLSWTSPSRSSVWSKLGHRSQTRPRPTGKKIRNSN